MEPQQEQIDLTRLNRRARRSLGKKHKVQIGGRNMPYVQRIHGSIFEYNTQRYKEIANDNEHNKAKATG